MIKSALIPSKKQKLEILYVLIEYGEYNLFLCLYITKEKKRIFYCNYHSSCTILIAFSITNFIPSLSIFISAICKIFNCWAFYSNWASGWPTAGVAL